MSRFNPVTVAGALSGAFGRHESLSLGDIAHPVVRALIAQAGIDPVEIDGAFVANGLGGMMQGQETILGQVLLAPIGIHSVPVHNVKNACSSGADAIHLACAAIASGHHDCVLVLGVEKMTDPEDGGKIMRALASASDRLPQEPGRSVFMDLNSERAARYMAAYGATKRHFAMCAAKNRRHAAMNPNAAVRKALSVDDILNDRVIVEPLTRAMCGGICDGAAAVILVSDAFARRKQIQGPRIVASAVVSGNPANTDRRTTATARAAKKAFEMAGLSPADISLAEVHDPSAPQEFFDIEEIGLCGLGDAIALVENGATSLGGRIPVNVSGGLTGRGHPVGATGVSQIAEVAIQLADRAGPSQVANARFGLAQMAGGLIGGDSAVATVHILSRQV